MPSLLQQLANRAKRFHSTTNIPQSVLAQAIQVEESNYSSFLKGKRGLSAESTCLLLKFVNMTPAQAVATFSKVPTSRICKLQEKNRRKKLHTGNGNINIGKLVTETSEPTVHQFAIKSKPLSSRIVHFSGNEGSWVSGLLGSGTDPNDAAIIVVPTGVKPVAPVHDPAVCAANTATTINVLGAVKTIYSQAADAIDDYIAKATSKRG
jgi:hypothetical protein